MSLFCNRIFLGFLILRRYFLEIKTLKRNLLECTILLKRIIISRYLKSFVKSQLIIGRQTTTTRCLSPVRLLVLLLYGMIARYFYP